MALCFLPGAFWLLSGSRLRAPPHHAAHDVFMTLPPYTNTREDQVRHLERGFKVWRVGTCREEMPSVMLPSPL